MTENEIKDQLAKEEFKIRSLAEANDLSIKISKEIKSILKKYGASLAEWNHNLYVVPAGFQVHSVWNFPKGVEFKPVDTGLKCEPYNNDYVIIKPFPTIKEKTKKSTCSA